MDIDRLQGRVEAEVARYKDYIPHELGVKVKKGEIVLVQYRKDTLESNTMR